MLFTQTLTAHCDKVLQLESGRQVRVTCPKLGHNYAITIFHSCFVPYKMWQLSFGLETVHRERVFLSRFSGLSVRAFFP